VEEAVDLSKTDYRMKFVFSYLDNKQRLFPKTALIVESLMFC